jgi:FG-GAP-like repeat
MHRILLACLAASFWSGAAQAADWQVQRVNAPARVNAVETVDGQVRISAGGLWYQVVVSYGKAAVTFIDSPGKPELPEGALPDSRVAVGTHDVARAWLAQPVSRYDHGILGDKIEAGTLVIETRDGRRQEVKLDDDAVFEDLEPRLADLDGNGHDDITVVKSYLKRGSALAVIAERNGKYRIVAETPPLGAPHRWLNPAGIADFTGDGRFDIALVRQPHVVGALELWSWGGSSLHKVAELDDTTNHVAGTRAIDMSAVADFDGDGVADLALPSLDRKSLRIVSFAPHAREIARVPLPAKAATNIGVTRSGNAPIIVLGLSDGSLAVVKQ